MKAEANIKFEDKKADKAVSSRIRESSEPTDKSHSDRVEKAVSGTSKDKGKKTDKYHRENAEVQPEARFVRKRGGAADDTDSDNSKSGKGGRKNKDKSKDKSKFSKWDNKHGKGGMDEHSLEKQTKAKKQHKPKSVEKEPEINMEELLTKIAEKNPRVAAITIVALVAIMAIQKIPPNE